MTKLKWFSKKVAKEIVRIAVYSTVILILEALGRFSLRLGRAYFSR